MVTRRYFCTPNSESYHATGAISNFLSKQGGIRYILERFSQGKIDSNDEEAYNHAPIDSYNVVEPRLNCQIRILVTQDLEAVGTIGGVLRRSIGVEPRNEAIQSVEHSSDGEVCLIGVHMDARLRDVVNFGTGSAWKMIPETNCHQTTHFINNIHKMKVRIPSFQFLEFHINFLRYLILKVSQHQDSYIPILAS